MHEQQVWQPLCRPYIAIAACLTLYLLHVGFEDNAAAKNERVLGFHNLHTKESIRLAYRRDGRLVPESLRHFSHLLRDHRRDEMIYIDPKLFDLLYDLRIKVGSDADYHVISGYRSAKTNAALKAAGRQVASKSMHIKGKAVDIRLPGVPLNKLHAAAVEMKLGGVGLYVKNDFIHVDLGRVRYW